jgi:hypothetical protein
MPGTFSKSTRPTQPGAYTNYDATAAATISPSTAAIVCVPLTHDWGPLKLATLVGSYAEFITRFGASATPGLLAVKQAFLGEGFAGRVGAGAVLVYRMGTGAAAKASRTLSNTTPAVAATVRAKYEGTKGNALTLTVQTNSVDSTQKDLIVLLSGVEVERFTNLATDVLGMATKVNANSAWITIDTPVTVDGVALGNVTASPLTTGNDGEVLTSTEWTAAMSALELERFGVLAPFVLTDGPTLTSLKTWSQGRNASGQRFLTVVGGASPDSMTTANSRSASLNDPNIVNIGGFAAVYTDETGLAQALSPAQLAPRVAGILAARGQNRSATFARMAGLALSVPPTAAEVDSAFLNGTVALGRDSYPDAPVKIIKALSTFTTKTDAKRPYAIFRNPKFMLTMHGLEQEVTEYGQSPGIIGELGVNDKTRAAVVGDAVTRLRTREEQGIIQGGWTVGVDQDPPPSDQDEFVALAYSLRFMRSVEQVFATIRVA